MPSRNMMRTGTSIWKAGSDRKWSESLRGNDHTTVLYAVRKITELRAHDEDLNKQIHVLDQTLREYL